ncbi:hypothetical protein NDU88_002918 [Pleurodeles waltl]|uniref:Uncharacterized protein n=1 Tax=Pleurodeles waltl TaxID=8319 RepID=A0AAV7NF48_PLEWA|nr:hypothetical protein NDU88_002918 [Pleurodeles waltl]
MAAKTSRGGGDTAGRVPGARGIRSLVPDSTRDSTWHGGIHENSPPGEKRQRQHMRQVERQRTERGRGPCWYRNHKGKEIWAPLAL